MTNYILFNVIGSVLGLMVIAFLYFKYIRHPPSKSK